jgi:hypothetical protein
VRGGLERDFVHGADRFTAGRLGGGGSRVLIPSFPSHDHLISVTVTDLLFLRSQPVKEQPSRLRADFPSKSSLPVEEQPSRQRVRGLEREENSRESLHLSQR